MAEFQYFTPVFNNGNAVVTNITQPIFSNVLTPTMTGRQGMSSFVFTGTVDVNTAITTAVSASESQVTSSGGLLLTNSTPNGYAFGLVVQFTTSDTLPTGISLSTDYYVVPVTTTSYRIATSYANALAGVYVAYTNTGAGNQTATPTALAGASVYLQGSNDYGVGNSAGTWFTVPYSTTTISADGSFQLNFPNVEFGNYRVGTGITTGQMAFSALQIGYKGDS